MRTLLAIKDSSLRKLFFTTGVLEKLASIGAYDWLEDVASEEGSVGLASVIANYEAVLTSWGSPFFTEEVLKRAARLKFIGHLAGSATAIVNEAVFARDVTMVTANPVLARSTAESAVALMMAGAWRLPEYIARLKRGGWSNNSQETVLGLSGRTIGLIGLGEISRNVISLLQGFSVRIKLYSRYGTEEEARSLGVALCSLEETLQASDIVSLHSSLTPATVGLLGKRELSLIRDGALFVNTARARIVDEEALVSELGTGRFAAALDVFHQEPLPLNHPLLRMDNVLCTPHIGGFAGALKRSFGEYVVNSLQAFQRGEQPAGQVTAADFARMTSNALA